MNFDSDGIMKAGPWNRKMMNFFWAVVIPCSILLESILLLAKGTDHFSKYAIPYIVTPTVILILGLALLEVVSRLKPGITDYCMLTATVFIVFTFVSIHSTVSAVFCTFVFPIWISTFYFQKRKVYFATALTYCSFFTLFLLRTDAHAFFSDIDEVMTITALLLLSPVISLSIMGRGREITDKLNKAAEAQRELMVRNILMDKLSKTDALTDLYNHITFHEYLDRLLEQMDGSNHRLPIHLAVADIDNFKKVNDTYGHRAGDAVLKSVADIIRRHLKADDIASRYGGEEFAIILTNKTIDEAYRLLDTFREELALIPHPLLDDQIVTISIGLKEYAWGEGKESLFNGADEALYQAKKTGKNRIVLSQRSILTKSV
jgi:diguanylate cyclase